MEDKKRWADRTSGFVRHVGRFACRDIINRRTTRASRARDRIFLDGRRARLRPH